MIVDNVLYFGKTGLADVLENIESAKAKNHKSLFVERITDSNILFELKDKGYILDNTSARFTIISWR